MKSIYKILILLLLYVGSVWGSNTITDARVDGDALILGFAGPLVTNKVTQFKIPAGAGNKLVFDFYGVVLRKPMLDRTLKHQQVWKFRIYKYKQNVVRVTIDAKKSYLLKHGMISSNKYRIDLPKAIKPKRPPKRPMPSPIVNSVGSNSVNSSNIGSDESLDTPYVASKVVKPSKSYTIVVDAGHGGKDSGALGGSRKYMEKVIALKIAKRVRYHLKKLGFNVLMTRSRDKYITLGGRTRYANKHKADAFISIHANATTRSKAKKARGIETYFLQTSRNARSERVAARENSVVKKEKNKLTKDVMLKLITGPKIELSNKMAIDVQKRMLTNVQKRYKYVKDNGVRPAPFWVLVGAQMPSILVEVGYITNPIERKRLFDSKYQDTIARGIAEGISTYFSHREKELE